MTSTAQLKAQAKYDKNHPRPILFKFNLTTDADILTRLDAVDNRQGYIKDLIRRDVRGPGKVLPVDSIRPLLLPVIKKYGILRIWLFGSYARGEATADSDIDLLIEGVSAKGMISFLALQEAMEKCLGKKVDLIEYDAAKNNNTRAGRRFLDHIERDRVLIYE